MDEWSQRKLATNFIDYVSNALLICPKPQSKKLVLQKFSTSKIRPNLTNYIEQYSSLVLFLGYSNGFFVFFQILSSMLEIIVYSIIDSKVFGVIICDNFLFAIRVKRFYNYKHAVE
jgi:hypothetical protein